MNMVQLEESNCNHAQERKQQAGANLLEMVKAVEKNDLAALRRLLLEADGANISEPMVKTTLPRRYHNVAGQVLTTPLRAAITWRNTEALQLILGAGCAVTDTDKGLALQKVSRRFESDVEIELFDSLLQHGGTLTSPTHYTIAIERLINDGNEYLLRRLLDVHFSGSVTTKGRGFLCLALASRGRSSTEGERSQYFRSTWQKTAHAGMLGLLRSGFNPGDFLRSSECWLNLESKYFHTIVSLLPLFVQVTPPSRLPVAAILRRGSRAYWYPMLKENERTIMRALPELLHRAGFDLRAILRAACLSPRFENELGFNDWASRKPEVKSLQAICRLAVRENLNVDNVYEGVERIPFFPKRLRGFMMFQDCLDDCGIKDSDCLCLSL